MAQWIKALVPKSDNLSSIPRNHVGERENQPLQVVLTSTHALYIKNKMLSNESKLYLGSVQNNSGD